MRYLRMGVKSYVRGQDIGLNLLRMVDKTEQIVLNVSLQKMVYLQDFMMTYLKKETAL